MKKISILGLDMQFKNSNNIDQMGRIIFYGKNEYCKNKNNKNSQLKRRINKLIIGNNIIFTSIKILILSSNSTFIEICQIIPIKNFIYINSLHNTFQIIMNCNDPYIILTINNNFSTKHNKIKKFSFDKTLNNYLQLPGFATIILIKNNNKLNQFIYGNIIGHVFNKNICVAYNESIIKSKIHSSEIQYIEINACMNKNVIESELVALKSIFNNKLKLNTAIGSTKNIIRNNESFYHIMSIIKTTIYLKQQYIPGALDWKDIQYQQFYDSTFYFPTESIPLYQNKKFLLYGGISIMETNQKKILKKAGLIIIENENHNRLNTNGFLAKSNIKILLLCSSNKKKIIYMIKNLTIKLNHNINYGLISMDLYKKINNKIKIYRLCLIADNKTELIYEIIKAEFGVKKSFLGKNNFKTPKGSFFSYNPINISINNNIVFMYPGIGAAYINLGKDLFHIFPEIYPNIINLTRNIKYNIKDNLINPRAIKALTLLESKKQDLKLRNSLSDIAECGVSYACIFTQIFKSIFNINENYACGYSMGEISMYAALRIWSKPDYMSHRLVKSNTFNNKLTGKLHALNKYWKYFEKKANKIYLWETYTVKASKKEIESLIMVREKVYITILNTPNSLVLGGLQEDCKKVLMRFKKKAINLHMSNVIHSPPAYTEYKNMMKLFSMSIHNKNKNNNTKIFSSSCYLPIPKRSNSITHAIAKCLCDPVNFPKLINTLHKNGAMIYIEMGPGKSLCNWVDKILNSQRHINISVNTKGTQNELTFIQTSAKFISIGLNTNLNCFFEGSIIVTNNNKYINKT